ncbi:MAG TPA: polysaccharide biosynthesis/export family protein [Candidatus Polarisedimenticolia bacterium]
MGSSRLAARRVASGAATSAILWILLAAQGFPAPEARSDPESLRAVELQPEGRLLRITLRSSAPFQKYTLARKGPPEKRDLLVRLPGSTTDLPETVDAGDYLLPITVTREGEGAAAELLVLFGGVGDSLVSVAQALDELRIVIIPPERRSNAADLYRIGVNDVLQIDVFGHEDLNKTLKVSPRGTISFPLIGSVRAEGQTVDDVAGDITSRLAKDYIQDPHVTVSVWEYLSQWINVVGEVVHPGRYYMTGATNLIDALSEAGGLKENAAGEILVTRRPEEVDPASAGEVFRIDIKNLFSDQGARLNMRLRSGDIVNVQEAPPGGSPRAAKP